MALLFFAQSIMPCADTIVNESKQNTQVVKSLEQCDNHTDDCSPLCHCSCCSGFSINHFIPSIINKVFYKSNPSGSFLISDVIEIALSIWQPPPQLV